MRQKSFWNHAVQEGIFFLLLGGALLWHGLESHSRAFIKDWSQSPYLFPVLVAVLLGALAVSLLCQGARAAVGAQTAVAGRGWAAGVSDQAADAAGPAKGVSASAASAPDIARPRRQTVQVLVVLAMSLGYYLALAMLKIPYITFGILSWSLTVSNFEVCTLVFLAAMMLYLGVRRARVLIAVPVGTTLFLSVAFRAMLHVLLP